MSIIEEAFDSLNHSFLLVVLKKFGFGTSFINWIEAILDKSESCVISSGETTQYFQLKSDSHLPKKKNLFASMIALQK